MGGPVAHLLVVDDEPRICRFVSRALEAHGHTVETARTGEDALRAAADRDFALVVLDLLLPGIDGYDVLEQLLVQDSRTRVLVLSAVGDVESRVRCLRMGAADYLPKPFAVAELIARVDSRMRERPTKAPSRWLKVGAVQLDQQKRVLHNGDRSTTLSQREFVLLGHLMRRAGEVCTRGELLADVWGFCFDPGSNVLDVYVGRLRSKLARQHIETVRNVGYCFSA
jgi:two-component system, OmpR family, response regulator